MYNVFDNISVIKIVKCVERLTKNENIKKACNRIELEARSLVFTDPVWKEELFNSIEDCKEKEILEFATVAFYYGNNDAIQHTRTHFEAWLNYLAGSRSLSKNLWDISYTKYDRTNAFERNKDFYLIERCGYKGSLKTILEWQKLFVDRLQKFSTMTYDEVKELI